jgi:hypothetical protein
MLPSSREGGTIRLLRCAISYFHYLGITDDDTATRDTNVDIAVDIRIFSSRLFELTSLGMQTLEEEAHSFSKES